MEKWSADFVNNPSDDYNLIVEILFEDKDVAVIQNSEKGLEIKWYPTDMDLVIPLDWLNGLLIEAKRRIGNE